TGLAHVGDRPRRPRALSRRRRRNRVAAAQPHGGAGAARRCARGRAVRPDHGERPGDDAAVPRAGATGLPPAGPRDGRDGAPDAGVGGPDGSYPARPAAAGRQLTEGPAMLFSTLVLRNLWNRKVRSFLTAGGLAVAVCAVVTLIGVADVFEQAVTQL